MRGCLHVQHKGRYLVIPIIFCFSLIVMSVLVNKFVVFGESGTQSWGEETAVCSNIQQSISSSLTKVMVMRLYLPEITEGLLSAWPQWCLSAEHQSTTLCQRIMVQLCEPRSDVWLHSPALRHLIPGPPSIYRSLQHLGLTLTTTSDMRWIICCYSCCQLTPLCLNFQSCKYQNRSPKFFISVLSSPPPHNWYTGAEEDLQFYYCCISLL